MTKAVIIPRIGETYEAALLDPNKSIFDSRYNGFKIILEGTKNITLAASTANQNFTEPHGLGFIPLVDAFAKRDAASQVFKPNGFDVEIWGAKAGMIGDVTFNYVAADATNMHFNFDNDKGSQVAVSIRYFCLEVIE